MGVSLQTAIVPRRSIIDDVLVVNEILDVATRFKKNCFMMNIEFKRHYDCLSWRFLRYLLKCLNFGVKWKCWMEVVVFHGSSSMVINGSVTRDFSLSKGLRQGDLTYFLFVLAMESLNGIMKKAMFEGFFRGIEVAEDVSFNILQFVDDTILMGERC